MLSVRFIFLVSFVMSGALYPVTVADVLQELAIVKESISDVSDALGCIFNAAPFESLGAALEEVSIDAKRSNNLDSCLSSMVSGLDLFAKNETYSSCLPVINAFRGVLYEVFGEVQPYRHLTQQAPVTLPLDDEDVVMVLLPVHRRGGCVVASTHQTLRERFGLPALTIKTSF